MSKNKKNNKPLIITSIISLVILAIVGFFLISNTFVRKSNDIEQFSLSDEYYHTNGKAINILDEIIRQKEETGSNLNDDELIRQYYNNLVDSKKSFVLYVSLPNCTGETANFREHVASFQIATKTSFYTLDSNYVKNTPVYDVVKYYPTVILFKDGQIVDYLHFDSDADTEYYKSLESFTNWMKSYIIL